MTTIVTELEKFRYNRLPMGIYASGYIIQAKVYNILVDIDGLKTCIDDILVLRKEFLSKHTDQIRVIFSRLCYAGMKANAPKFIFGLK